VEGGGGADRIAGVPLADVSHVYQENMSLPAGLRGGVCMHLPLS
jgi:hypothetical protein